MGLSFHYNGRIADKKLLPRIIEDLEDIAKLHKWKYKILNSEFPIEEVETDVHDQKVYGIFFTPPECETVFVSFLSNGRLSSPLLLEFWGDATDDPETGYLYMLSVKTQYAGPEIHKLLMGIFHYLNKEYFAEFKLHDEGDYWNTQDDALLLRNFNQNAFLIKSFKSVLKSLPIEEDEKPEDYISRIIKEIKHKQHPKKSDDELPNED
ncbi:MAG: hypothetical protein WCJ61_12105 [Paludibacter sp.]